MSNEIVPREERSFMPTGRPQVTRDTILSDEERRFQSDVSSIATSLREVSEFLSFVKKWSPWMIAMVGLLYPTIGKIVGSIPPLPH